MSFAKYIYLAFSMLPVTAFSQGHEVKPEYFGIHIFYPGGEKIDAKTTASSIPDYFGAWRLHTAQRLTWRDMAPVAGKQLDFSVADVYMDIASKSKMKVLWTLGSSTPKWAAADPRAKALSGQDGSSSTPANEGDWLGYIEGVLGRYPNRIEAVEIWNEPDTTDDRGIGHSYHGSMKQLVRLTCATYKKVKELSPKVLVVSPSFTGDAQVGMRLKSFLKMGGGQCIDVLGFHSYEYQGTGPFHLTRQVQQVQKIIREAGIAKMPIWNTEFGLLVQNLEDEVKPASKWGGLNKVHSEVEAASLATKYLMWGAVSGLDRFYWFAWDSRTMGLTRKNRRQMNMVGMATRAVAVWSTGQKVTECGDRPKMAVAQCKFGVAKPNMLIVWPEGKFKIPENAEATTVLGEIIKGPTSLSGNGLPLRILGDGISKMDEVN
ncbi:hypothetical protein EIP75_23460 [Aquabacterium soli]|uniref:Asl1-like glycosyl hydrolase catalytic domain-containing protein n=1 Tax=Aquabacterium soli TaxID=2493092 RepID=A0A3R8T875_9BURK|nr:glycosyl hydrolase [Aquabacterium soli]RRR99939.1 hypothetical protein EIP75_23460 [Aquabacterium soli]